MEAIQGILPIIGAGTAGAGLVGNILSSIQRGKVASQAEKNATLSPTQLGNMVATATQPLDRSLINMVNNQVQGDMASRGLAEAPGIFAATESQALAPFQQQNQQTALNLILEKLGLPNQTLAALSASPGGANLLPLIQLLMQNRGSAPAPPAPPWSVIEEANPWVTGTSPGLTAPNNWTGSTDVPVIGPVSA